MLYQNSVSTVAKRGATPLVVADGKKVLGTIELKDMVKAGFASALPNFEKWAFELSWSLR